METTKMKIEYRKQVDSETAPWQLLTNMDELLWNGVYALRVAHDDGSHNLPFSFANDDTVTVVVKDHSHEGMLENGRTIVQTITRVERSTGKVFVYTRTRCNVDNTPSWGYWTLATDGGAVIEIPKATKVSLGGVVVGDALAVDADGKISVAAGAIGYQQLSPSITGRIGEMAEKLQLAEPLVVNDGIVLHTGSLVKDSTPYSGTAFRAYTTRIHAGGELLVANAGYSITVCKLFDGEEEVAFIDCLDENCYQLSDKGYSYQFEFKKLDDTAFTADELPLVIKSFHRNPVVWNAGSNIDDYLSAGTYTICGARENLADGLPIANTGAIDARLVVLSGGGCVIQVLTLLNVDGGDGNLYTRTRQNSRWGKWGRLQTNIDVGQVDSLNAFVDNGIYSGVWTKGHNNAGPLTFVCVVINDYALRISPRRVSQFVYGLSKPDGTVVCISRAGKGDTITWGEWKDVNDDNIKNLVQGTGVNSNGWREPFKRLKDVGTFQELFEGVVKDGVKMQLGLNDMHGTTAAATKDYIGCFRVNVNGLPVELFSTVEGYASDRWSQVITTSRVLVNEVAVAETSYNTHDPKHKYRKYTYTQKFEILNKYDEANVIKRYARNCNGGVWSDWREVGGQYVSSRNYGKRIALFGGSFAQNMAVNTTDYQFDYKGQKTNLLPYIADKLGATAFDDYAVGGQGMMATDKENGGKFYVPLIEQLQTAGAGYDIYIIMGGINDYGQDVPLGTSSGAADDTTYCGGLKKAFDWIKVANPYARIYTITPFKCFDNARAVELDPDHVKHNNHKDRYWNPHTNIKNADGHTFYEYVQAQKEVALIAGVPCFDLWANQQFSGAQAQKYYLTDYTHPNGTGYQAVADALVEFLAYGVGSGAVDFQALAGPHIKSAIEQGKQLALRSLFVAAGAEYNENTGFYSLNGVSDLTENDIMLSYINKDAIYRLNIPRVLQGSSIRTIYPYVGHKNLGDVFMNTPLSGYCTFTSAKLEILKFAKSSYSSMDSIISAEMPLAANVEWDSTFLNCTSLREIWPIDVRKVPSFSVTVFKGCSSLAELRLLGVSNSLHLGDSVDIRKTSIIYIVSNSRPTSAMTITLHPDAYARLADDAEIVAALEAQPLISLVSA